MCLVCSVTSTPVCSGGVCEVSFWQQNVNLLIMVVTPILGGISLWMKNLISKLIKK